MLPSMGMPVSEGSIFGAPMIVPVKMPTIRKRKTEDDEDEEWKESDDESDADDDDESEQQPLPPLPELPALPALPTPLPTQSKPPEPKPKPKAKAKPKTQTKTKPTSAERRAFRAFATYPKVLSDVTRVGALDIECASPEYVRSIKEPAMAKVALVREGKFAFGCPVVIPSFQPVEDSKMKFVLPAVIANLFFMNIMCSEDVMFTEHGKVSVFPVTVFKHAPKAQSVGTGNEAPKGGEPCLAVHIAHFKKLTWRLYGASRKVVSNESLRSGLADVVLKYSPADDTPLTILAGVDEYDDPKLKASGGFILLSALWFDVMKEFFVSGKTMARNDIGLLFTRIYEDIEEVKNKFDNEFRCIWLGDERPANVDSMVMIDQSRKAKPRVHAPDHRFSMTSVRALNGEVNVGVSGRRWVLDRAKVQNPVKYNDLSFAYGVQCWTEQLKMLNSAHVYFTTRTPQDLDVLPRPVHMRGLFALTHSVKAEDRVACIHKGILNDSEPMCTSPNIRKQRYRISRTYGPEKLINYFGEQNVEVYRANPEKRARRLKKAADEMAEANEFDDPDGTDSDN